EGVFPFSINGFETRMEFKKGRARFTDEPASSTLLYIKYKGEPAAVSRLFYVYRDAAGAWSVIPIPLALLVIVPLALVFLGVFFRRLIVIMLLLLGAFFYFNSSKGLSPGSFFDAVREWVMGLL
ncbi:MAG TPA: hypothetical protein VD772_12825, partial [Anseongella sp.]|nr:hypothetical protein [Anseongella sp.]